VARVRVGEQEVELALPQLGGDRAQLLRDLLAQLGVILGELVELDQITRAPLELLPRGRELAVFERLTRPVARRRGIVPRAGSG
jgi:hypothetical protein